MSNKKLSYTDKKYLEIEAEMMDRINERRGKDGLTQVIYVKRKTNQLEEDKVFGFQTKYTFLQYLRIVMRWACGKLDVSSRYVDLLLYLYPIGVFNTLQFNRICATMQMYQRRELNYMMDKGLLRVWRIGDKSKNVYERTATLYSLSDKAAKVCARMHRVLLGEQGLPENHNNPLEKSNSKKVIDKYYMEKIKEMNKRVEEKRAEQDSNL